MVEAIEVGEIDAMFRGRGIRGMVKAPHLYGVVRGKPTGMHPAVDPHIDVDVYVV